MIDMCMLENRTGNIMSQRASMPGYRPNRNSNFTHNVPTIIKSAVSIGDRKRESFEHMIEASDEYKSMNDGQKHAIKTMARGYNTFLTGGGGVGKSFVTRTFIKLARDAGYNVIACAPTGVAAVNLGMGALTIHRALGIKYADYYIPESENSERIMYIGEGGCKCLLKLNEPCNEADIIIIDEISMCRIDLFSAAMQLLAECAAYCKHPKQIVVVGDFYQLPPVVQPKDKKILREFPEYREGWCFESRWWNRANFKTIELTEIRRQTDPVFIENLNKARLGDRSCLDYFKQCVNTEAPTGTIKLVGTNRYADVINANNVELIPGKAHIYLARIEGNVKPSDKTAPDMLVIKRGMRVMATVNSQISLLEYQNGSIGTVVDCDDKTVRVLFDGKERETTIESYELKIKKPVIQYDDNGKKIFGTETIGTFTQIPLKPAYAVTIHKSQGKTYDELVISPECFAAGQLYVALSRATNIKGLHIIGDIPPESLFSSDTVKEFYSSLTKQTF